MFLLVGILITQLCCTGALEEQMTVNSELKTSVEELKMANEYQLRLKDMTFGEKLTELTDKFNMEIDALKTHLTIVTNQRDRENAAHTLEMEKVKKE
jgi:hypothetical protein